MEQKGIVYLVGAGPGRADLITVRGQELLRQADCVIYDRLAGATLLAYARQDAELIPVPKRIGLPSVPGSVSQDQINDLIVERALAGKAVVRLKGGDPTIFGRVAEEMAVLAGAGIAFEIVPGVTAALGASAYTGILLTDRTSSSQVVFVTGHEAEGKTTSSIDWAHLARFQGAIVFYMGMTNLGGIAQALIQNGMDKATPCAVIADATLPTQRTVRDTLDRLADRCRQEDLQPPAIVVVGRVVGEDDRLAWFSRLPLFGRTIVVTRDARGNAEFAQRIIACGGNPLAHATIRLRPLTEGAPFLEVLSRLGRYQWLVFTSASGVEFFFAALDRMGKDARSLGAASVAAIGPATSERLRSLGIKADLVPREFTSLGLGRQLMEGASLKGRDILLLRSELADDELKDLLEAAGAQVDQVAVYTAEPAPGDARLLIEQIREGRVHWLTFASSSESRAFFGQVPADLVSARGVKVASIGPVTSGQLRQLGLKVDAEARDHTLDGLIQAMIGSSP